MEKLKNFLSLKNIEDTQIYKELKCAKNEALILRELCRNYVVSIFLLSMPLLYYRQFLEMISIFILMLWRI